jgi:hypothetical protein
MRAFMLVAYPVYDIMLFDTYPNIGASQEAAVNRVASNIRHPGQGSEATASRDLLVA